MQEENLMLCVQMRFSKSGTRNFDFVFWLCQGFDQKIAKDLFGFAVNKMGFIWYHRVMKATDHWSWLPWQKKDFNVQFSKVAPKFFLTYQNVQRDRRKCKRKPRHQNTTFVILKLSVVLLSSLLCQNLSNYYRALLKWWLEKLHYRRITNTFWDIWYNIESFSLSISNMTHNLCTTEQGSVTNKSFRS